MEKHFDKIDIILISLISICLLIILIGLMWIILSKLEDKEVNKKKKTGTKDKKITKKKTNQSRRKSGYVSPHKRKKPKKKIRIY